MAQEKITPRGEDYAQRMREGWDREASSPYFQAVAEEVERIWVTAGDAEPAESSKPAIERLQSLLAKLRAIYNAP